MRTIEVNLYSFNELSEDAQRTALNNFEPHVGYIWDDAQQSIKAFAEEFNVRFPRQYDNPSFGHIDDCILELSGTRLRTYLLNNFYSILFERKPQGEYKAGKYPRRSKIQYTETCCPFTGVCYDEDLLSDIRKFIASPDTNTTFEQLLRDCVHNLHKSVEDEIQYRHSDEAKIEDIKANCYEFTENGKLA